MTRDGRLNLVAGVAGGLWLTVWIGLMVLVVSLAWGQALPATKPSPHPTEPSAAEQWKTYADYLRQTLYRMELEWAVSKAQVEKAKTMYDAAIKERDAAVKELETFKAKHESESGKATP